MEEEDWEYAVEKLNPNVPLLFSVIFGEANDGVSLGVWRLEVVSVMPRCDVLSIGSEVLTIAVDATSETKLIINIKSGNFKLSNMIYMASLRSIRSLS